jgi:hypothetical protein
MGEMPEPTPPAPALPTVSMSGDFNDQNNKFSFANSHVNTTVLPNATCIMYEWGTQQYKEYDTTKSYAIWSYSLLNGSLVGRTGFSVEPLTSGGQTIIQCLNSTSKNITASYCFIAVCSSPDATVITVYDSSNNPYNAFKYTSDGTDYYYVLDGTQTDWTDDLASIGYRLWNLKVYGQYGNTFSLSNENNFMFVETGGTYSMLNGGTASTTWEIFGIYDSNGNELSHESDYIWWINASNIYYKASPTRSVSVAYALLIVKPPIS